MDYTYEKGVAFIVEGDTEKEFHMSLLNYLCRKYSSEFIRQWFDNGTDIAYMIKHLNRNTLVKFYSVNTISQVPQSGRWFTSQCVSKHKDVPFWIVFLCYDTDSYKDDVTKFHEGDWKKLRSALKKAQKIVDLAAAADIEDVILKDLQGVCEFIGCNLPEKLIGRKGKVKLRNLYRDHGCSYHEGKRARPLIDSLNMQRIIDSNIIPLNELEDLIFD